MSYNTSRKAQTKTTGWSAASKRRNGYYSDYSYSEADLGGGRYRDADADYLSEDYS